MSTTQHTPGPWKVHADPQDTSEGWLLVTAGGKAGPIVANVNPESCPDIQSAPAFRKMPVAANASLIAAAPELLEALRYAREFIRDEHGDGPTLRKIDAAIAKATGRTAD